MKKVIVILLTLVAASIVGVTGGTFAADYKYITAEELNSRLAAESPMILIDICPMEQFAKGHIKGAIETNAYPVKTEEEKARLAIHLPTIMASTDDVIIICPRGGGGAKGTFDFYRDGGVDVNRLLILEQGMDKWPFETEAK